MNDTAQNDPGNTNSSETVLSVEQRTALDIARDMARAGIPIFVAPPDPTDNIGFKLPARWQQTVADPRAVDAWRPGMALCAVGGHTADFADVDPRNGGHHSAVLLAAGNLWPRTFGEQATPSDGKHYLITPLGIGKHQGKGELLGGIDLQGGRADGTGRGFVFLAPTVRRSKVTGEPVPYRWEVPPRLDELAEWFGVDDTGAGLADLIKRVQSITEDRPAPTDPGPFDAPPRTFTIEQAKAWIGPKLEAFKNLRDGIDSGYNAALNDLACTYSHFIPTYVSAEVATRQMFEAAKLNGSVDYQGAAGVRATIRSGLAQSSDPWRAELPPDPSDAPAKIGADEVAPTLDAVDALLAEMLTASEIAALPNPVPLISGVLDMDSLAWIIGAPGSYKSFVALDFAGHVGAGRSWRGHRVRQGPVVYLVAEGAGGMSLRARAWQSTYGPMTDVRFLPRPVQASGSEWAVLVAACERIKPALIVVDTQARVTVGMNENDNSEMGIFVEQAEKLRRATGACMLIVHHTGRGGGDARGASAIDAAQGTELKVERAEDLRGRIVMDKQKDMAMDEPIEFDLVRVDQGTDPETGRDLSSLVLSVAMDTVRVPVRDWVDRLTDNQAEVIGIVRDHFPLMGGTKPDIKRVLQERRAARGEAAMAHGSYSRAWDALTERQILLRIEPSQRYGLDVIADVTELASAGGATAPDMS